MSVCGGIAVVNLNNHSRQFLARVRHCLLVCDTNQSAMLFAAAVILAGQILYQSKNAKVATVRFWEKLNGPLMSRIGMGPARCVAVEY